MYLRFSSRWALLVVVALFWLLLVISSTLWAMSLVQRTTAAGTRPHALVRVSRHGYDVGLDTVPARVHHAGRIQLWFYGSSDPAPTTIISIPGSPALPAT